MVILGLQMIFLVYFLPFRMSQMSYNKHIFLFKLAVGEGRLMGQGVIQIQEKESEESMK